MTTVLVPSGIEISDVSFHVLRHSIMNVDQWLIDALAARIRTAEIKAIDDYLMEIMQDPEVTPKPSSREEILSCIISRQYFTEVEG